MNPQALTTFNPEAIDRALEMFTESAALLRRACEIIYTMHRADPEATREHIRQRQPMLGDKLYRAIIRSGEGSLDPRLINPQTLGAERLSHCDLTTQERYLSEPVAVACPNQPDQTRLIPVGDLEPHQVNQVFARDGRTCYLRTHQQQRTWLEHEAYRRTASAAPSVPYVITKNRVTFTTGCVMDRAQICELLKQL
jgi:hypothetical protein